MAGRFFYDIAKIIVMRTIGAMTGSTVKNGGYTVSEILTQGASGAASRARAPSASPFQSRAGLRNNTQMNRLSFSIMALTIDFAAILLASAGADYAYSSIVYRWAEICVANLQLGLFAAVAFVALNAFRHNYALADYLNLSGHAQRVFTQWNVAFLAAATFGFFARVIEDSSRGTFILLYVGGLCALYAARAVVVVVMMRSAGRGGVLASRVMLVGFSADIDAFNRLYQPHRQGVSIVASPILRDSAARLDTDIAAAMEAARRCSPDDIMIVVPWGRADVIDKCVTAFLSVPAAIHLHLEPDSVLNHCDGAQTSGDGSMASLRLRAPTMSLAGVVAKRVADLCLASLGLILLSPLFLFVALAIKLDSRGPVFFFQTRQGFNKKQFRIVKFRSMTAMEDGASVVQAKANDPRITRVGRILRRFNIDELPQLLNVFSGEMSLVGPRPHALVHDEQFEPIVALYARRHNVKPGITGWAQVNGARGETDTSDKISQRIRYDLYYIDNWSLTLDLWIVFLTLFSKKAYRNAG